MADKIFERDNLISYRFPCGCLWAGHSCEITLELGEGGQVLECSLNLYMAGKSPLKYRLKQIWELLRGEDGQLADFVIRPEDIPEIVNLLSRALTKPDFSQETTTNLRW